MSQSVRLRMNKSLEGETLESGVLVEIRALAPSGRSRLVQRVPVPVGQSNSYRNVDLEPGRYELTACLPSGELLSQTVDVAEQPGSLDVVLQGESSPHEWLSWQHLLGNVPGRKDFKILSSSIQPASRRDFGENLSYSISGEPEDLPEPAAKLWLVPAAPIDPVWPRLDQGLAQLAPGKPVDPAQLFPPGAEARDIPLQGDPPYAVARLDRGVAFNFDRRAYLVCRRDSEAILCAMPYPWPQSDGSGEALVEATLAVDEESLESGLTDSMEKPGWSVRTSVRDRFLGSVLSYLSSGDAASARELLQPARELLFDKMVNPMAAAGGGYILVDEWVRGSSQLGSDTRWHSWIDNLSNWFPWLPDGAILQGWLALRRRDQPPDLGKARVALLEAERRGIPIYTAGVRRLSDGLMLLAGEAQRKGAPDPEVDEAMARVRRLAWQVDPRQPFTCVRLMSS
jgi:hypothetical protein